MANFSFNCTKQTAIVNVKKALIGKVAILKDKGDVIVVGSPMMTVTITFTNNEVSTKSNLFGKALLGTINNFIELADGFVKM